VVTLTLTLVLRRTGVRDDGDETRAEDFDELAEDAAVPVAGVRVPVA
jgi:hypothetical protein